MSKKKKKKNNDNITTNKDICEYILNDYAYDDNLIRNDDMIRNLNMLVGNNLAVKISGEDDIYPGYVTRFNIACKFMSKYNKKLKKHRREVEMNPDEIGTFADTNEEVRELAKYILEKGTYYAMLDNVNYMVLFVGTNESIDSKNNRDEYFHYDIYFVGDKCIKWKNKYFDMYKKFKSLQKTSRAEAIYYSDGTRKEDVKFKTFDKVIFEEKDKVLTYIDNWVKNIPTYYKYGMVPKLSILLHGRPGTGKSTFYKALASYLDIKQVCCILPGHFMNDEQPQQSSSRMMNSNRYNSMRLPRTMFAIDDIDCICESRENTKDKENSKTLSNLLAFLDNPDTFYFKAKDGVFYPVSIVVASTNYYDRLDEAVTRFGRFDLTVEMKYFDLKEAKDMCAAYDLNIDDVLDKKNYSKKDFTISPAELQALCMENIDKSLKKDK